MLDFWDCPCFPILALTKKDGLVQGQVGINLMIGNDCLGASSWRDLGDIYLVVGHGLIAIVVVDIDGSKGQDGQRNAILELFGLIAKLQVWELGAAWTSCRLRRHRSHIQSFQESSLPPGKMMTCTPESVDIRCKNQNLWLGYQWVMDGSWMFPYFLQWLSH